MSLRQELIEIFSAEPPQTLQSRSLRYACVAVLLCGENRENLQVGFIRRALDEKDPWSGQVAFPGGKKEPGDASDLAVALRETAEEVGIFLEAQEQVGRLHDVQARQRAQLLDFYISPFVFYLERPVTPRLDLGEVSDFFWVPLNHLEDEAQRMDYLFARDQIQIQMPAIRLLQDPPLWGLTYLMTQNLLRLLKRKKP